MVAFNYTLHEDDETALAYMRYQLIGLRTAAGITQAEGGARIGRSDNFLYEMEGMRSTPQLSHLQDWAAIFDMRLEMQLDGFWLHPWPCDELSMLYTLSRPFHARSWQRLWLVSALKAWREKQGISTTQLGEALGMSRKGVAFWEAKSPDPMLGRVMVQARATGTAVELRLWPRKEWIFG